MKKTRVRSCLAFALSAFAAGCAGDLDQGLFPPDGATSGGSGGSTGTPTTSAGTSTGGTTGAGGSGSLPVPNTCVMTSMKGCAVIGCHSASGGVAGLNLSFAALTTSYKSLYYDKLNAGLTPPDPMACAAGVGKLVDSANPMQSLIYAKVLTAAERDAMMMPPCGGAMPSIGASTDADKACIMMWITDVIAGSKATP